MLDLVLLLQVILVALMMGSLYCLMALGITFIYSVMKIINWSMAGYYMIGGYLQFYIITQFLGPHLWFLAIAITMLTVFVIGMGYNRIVLSGLYERGVTRKFEYATVLTIFTMYFFENSAIYFIGERIYTPPEYFPRITIGPLFLSGSKVVGSIGAVVVLIVLYLFLKKSWWGLALRAASQERIGSLAAGINLTRLDMIAFGLGCALAAAAGAYLAPIYLVYPTCGNITTTKGFNIIIIGGLGSIPGAIIGGLLLGFTETFGAVYLASRYRDIYGFALLIFILLWKPAGLFGEKRKAESLGTME